jgi:hypothetical protein
MENNQTLKLWYESGAVDVYYGHKRKRLKDLTPKEEDAYWKGYNDEPYGRKDNGYDEE